MNMENLLAISPTELVQWLAARNIRRFHLALDQGSGLMMASHQELKPLADFINSDTRDFMGHEGLFFQISEKHDTLQGAFVHRTCRGQAAGGVRYWSYDTVEDYLRDGMRLAKGMTRKNALAGLWWGGGKGVMAHNPDQVKTDPGHREDIYQDYGRLLSDLRGCYVTAEDVGTHVVDMANVFSTTRFTTCIPEALGGSGNPSAPTARGVVSGMEAALEFAGMGTLHGKTVAVQGMGNVGAPLIGFLFEKGVSRVVAADINPELADNLRAGLEGHLQPDQELETRIVEIGNHDILAEECDIVAPCATGAILNPETIPGIRARIVCGASNNQLEDAARDDAALSEAGIIYVPDFLTNRMGIVNCANEAYGYVNNDEFIERHLERTWEHSVFKTTLQVLRDSQSSDVAPARTAMNLADELSLQPHPVFGHRGVRIIDSLVNDRWFDHA
jgi:glutamate dehydrogenase/leucine dehydrogenase